MKGANNQTALAQMLKKWELKLSSSTPKDLLLDNSSEDKATSVNCCGHYWDMEEIKDPSERRRIILSLALDLCSEMKPPQKKDNEVKVIRASDRKPFQGVTKTFSKK